MSQCKFVHDDEADGVTYNCVEEAGHKPPHCDHIGRKTCAWRLSGTPHLSLRQRVESITAEAIAAWLERGLRDGSLVGWALHELADDVRAGAWRKP